MQIARQFETMRALRRGLSTAVFAAVAAAGCSGSPLVGGTGGSPGFGGAPCTVSTIGGTCQVLSGAE